MKRRVLYILLSSLQKEKSLHDEVLKSKRNVRPPPNMLCMHDNVTKVPHDFLPFHHVRAPRFPHAFALE